MVPAPIMRLFFAPFCLLAVGSVALAQTTSELPEQTFWRNHVEPILSRNCYKCHGGVKQKGGLDLRLPQTIFQGGDDGSAVMPGRADQSPIYQRILPGAQDHMPPEHGKQLTPEEISLIQHWITILPTNRPGHPTTLPANWSRKTPSLLELATSTHWQPPSDLQPPAVIDLLIERQWKEKAIAAAPVADDRTFVRRIYLDLAGRIPTRPEADAFVNTADPAKRANLIDQLLASPDYARHMAQVLDIILMERKGPREEAQRREHGWFDYLQKSIAANRPWNKIVADLITARPESPDQKGAVWFLYEKKNNHQQMAEGIAPIVFGVSIGCAQCHDHPLAREIQQKHYWGLVAAFNRTSNADTPSGAGVSESAIGGFVSFTNLKKESQPAIMALLSGQTIAEKRPAEGAKETDSDANYLSPPSKDPKHPNRAAIPKFSRRQALADAVTRDNPLLARAMVNRVWDLLMGRGLVSPVDQMDSRHPPSHPELLAWLSADFQSHGYDLQRLVRMITLSRAYQLDSRTTAAPPAPELYARGLEKPLLAEVLCRSLLIATGSPAASSPDSPAAQALCHKLIATFPDLNPTEYNATLQQAMFLSNDPLIDDLLKPDGQNLTSRLLKLSSSREQVREAFLSILGREPAEDELNESIAYLQARKGRPEDALRQFSWALLSSAEFLMNH